MGCTSCAKKKVNSYQDFKALESPPYRATDIITYNIESNDSSKFASGDWNSDITNVLLFTPSIEAINEVGDLVADKNINYTYVTSQPLHEIKDYLDNNEVSLQVNKIFYSYLLPSRLNLIHNGFTKKAIVYIMKDGDLASQQLFYNSSFNYNHINEFLGDYSNDIN